MKKYEILEKIQKNGIVAVVRSDNDLEMYEDVKKIISGGIKILELTFTTPYVENVIEKLSKEFLADKNVIIGAGTVLDSMTARLAIIKGAKFIVGPNFDVDVAKMCNLYCVPYFPGCSSVNEIKLALEYGCSVIKLFPGNQFGPKYIKNLKGPIPYLEVMPSGGVDLNNMNEWIEAGVYSISVGSYLTEIKSEIVNRTREVVNKYNEIKGI